MPTHEYYTLTPEQARDAQLGQMCLLLHKTMDEVKKMNLRDFAVIWATHKAMTEADAHRQKRQELKALALQRAKGH